MAAAVHTIGGCCSLESNRRRYGVEGQPNCRDNFLTALEPHGLGPKDIVANINFFTPEFGAVWMLPHFRHSADPEQELLKLRGT